MWSAHGWPQMTQRASGPAETGGKTRTRKPAQVESPRMREAPHVKTVVKNTPALAAPALFLIRAKIACRHIFRTAKTAVRWLFTSKEATNFTYHLAPLNQRYLAATIAHITGTDYATAVKYLTEAAEDIPLTRHIAETTKRSPHANRADNQVRFARRLGWYAFVRILKPRVVVETGVDKGLGACVITAALQRNTAEGHPGRYFGTDINPQAGYLLSGEYAQYGEILYGDSIESLQALDEQIDLFINDSDHSADYEAAEYETVADKLSSGAIVLGDNAHGTGRLLDFSLAHGRRFLFFAEKPSGHWYPGAGIGVSF